MSTLLKCYQSPQWVKEATVGTDLAATSKIACMDFNITLDDMADDPAILNAFATASKGYEVILSRGVHWEVPESPVVFDQIHAWLGMGLVDPTVSGAGPYTYVMDSLPTAALIGGATGIDARTFQVSLKDGAGTTADWKFNYGVLDELKISGGANQQLKFSAKGFGRVLTSGAVTGALSLPSIVQEPFALTSAYIDLTAASYGTTNVAGQVLGWTWTLNPGWVPVMTADARSNLDFTLAVLDPTKRKAVLEMDILATAGGQWATEKTAAEALTLRAVELRCVGALSSTYSLKLQGLYKYKPTASLFPSGDQDGQQVAKLHLEASPLGASWQKAIVLNQTATLV